MAESLHPAATDHLPSFITPPGETDILMVVMGAVLIVSVLAFGILYFTLHSLPERIAHRTHKLQFEIVAVLGLISLFTHMHIFWIIGLLLAFVDIPDFGGHLNRIAGSVEKMAGNRPADRETAESLEAIVDFPADHARSSVAQGVGTGMQRSEGTAVARPERQSQERKELSRA